MKVGEVGLVDVVEVLLAVPRAAPAQPAGLASSSRVLEERVEDIEPEAVDPAIEPAPDHVTMGLLDRRVAPVQLGLVDQERVVVELPAGLVPLQPGPPKNDTQLLGGIGAVGVGPAGSRHR